jgi:hypothetical protein
VILKYINSKKEREEEEQERLYNEEKALKIPEDELDGSKYAMGVGLLRFTN